MLCVEAMLLNTKVEDLKGIQNHSLQRNASELYLASAAYIDVHIKAVIVSAVTMRLDLVIVGHEC